MQTTMPTMPQTVTQATGGAAVGGSDRVHVNGLTFALSIMFPDDQDVPPARPTTARLPRPPQSRRLFSSGRDGQPYTIEVFGNDQLSPTVSMRGHRQALEAAGFHVTEREYTPSRVTYNAQRSDVTLTIVVASDDMGGCTTSVLASEVVQ